MARGDGIHRTNARNMRLTAAKIGNAQAAQRTGKGILCQSGYCTGDGRTSTSISRNRPPEYAEMFEQMKEDGVISTRGLKEDAYISTAS